MSASGGSAPVRGRRSVLRVRRPIERRIMNIFFTNRNRKPFAEALQFVVADFLLLMGDVLSFTALTQPVPLDRAGKNDGRFTIRLNRLMECRINFLWVVTTQAEVSQGKESRDLGCEVLALPEENGRPSIMALLDELGRRRLTNDSRSNRPNVAVAIARGTGLSPHLALRERKGHTYPDVLTASLLRRRPWSRTALRAAAARPRSGP